MSGTFSNVTICGRVGSDPDVKHFESGSSVASFSLAVDNYKKDSEPHWIPVKVWGKAAETVATYVKKGDLMSCTGELVQEKWKDKDGSNRSKILVNVNRVVLMGSKTQDASESEKYDDLVF